VQNASEMHMWAGTIVVSLKIEDGAY
jgi:hypothetical protein